LAHLISSLWKTQKTRTVNRTTIVVVATALAVTVTVTVTVVVCDCYSGGDSDKSLTRDFCFVL